MTATPRWLDAYATRTGQDPALLGTKAVPRHCRTCRLLVLAGYDAPVMGLLIRADPYRLTPQLEAACVVIGRPTVRLWGIAGRYELTTRFHPGVPPLGRQPSADHVVVLAAHACGQPPLTRDPLPASSHVTNPDGPPPF